MNWDYDLEPPSSEEFLPSIDLCIECPTCPGEPDCDWDEENGTCNQMRPEDD